MIQGGCNKSMAMFHTSSAVLSYDPIQKRSLTMRKKWPNQKKPRQYLYISMPTPLNAIACSQNTIWPPLSQHLILTRRLV